MNLRIDKFNNILLKKRIDSFFLSNPANISYLVNFKAEDSYLFIGKNENLLITDSRYSAEYKNLIKDDKLTILEIDKNLTISLKEINKRFKIKNIAFEQEHISYYFYQKLKQIFGKRLTPVTDIVENMRAIKDAEELKLIKKAISITLDTFKYIKKILKPGLKETELAREIEYHIRLKGAACAAFDIIVASGPNSSYPHAKKTDRIISNNEPILIDMGVDYNGYKSDLTRVFFLGKINPLFNKVYNTVKNAQEKTKSLIRSGTVMGGIDKTARDFIENSGFEESCFKHSLGHGVGLDVHELPGISPNNKNILKTGMVFTLEPAIYLEGKFGVRIEDMVLVTRDGMEILSGS